ncbi:hypothetical protein KAJ38_00555 [Candidatus Pacearchaeota archaeon]|nr:hypothetical protein [Candidatus Pacearchaeota archaeon]
MEEIFSKWSSLEERLDVKRKEKDNIPPIIKEQRLISMIKSVFKYPKEAGIFIDIVTAEKEINKQLEYLGNQYIERLEFFPGSKESYEQRMEYKVEFVKDLSKVTKSSKDIDNYCAFIAKEMLINGHYIKIVEPSLDLLMLNKVIAVVDSRITSNSSASESWSSSHKMEEKLEYGVPVRRA